MAGLMNAFFAVLAGADALIILRQSQPRKNSYPRHKTEAFLPLRQPAPWLMFFQKCPFRIHPRLRCPVRAVFQVEPVGCVGLQLDAVRGLYGRHEPAIARGPLNGPEPVLVDPADPLRPPERPVSVVRLRLLSDLGLLEQQLSIPDLAPTGPLAVLVAIWVRVDRYVAEVALGLVRAADGRVGALASELLGVSGVSDIGATFCISWWRTRPCGFCS